MQTRLLFRPITQTALVCFIVASTLAACDRRTYSTTVYSADATATDSVSVVSGGVDSTTEGNGVGSTAPEGTIDDPAQAQNAVDPITGEPLQPTEGLPVDVEGPAVEPVLPPGELPSAVPGSVPQGPDIDRVGSGSIYQPIGDVDVPTFTIDGRRSRALAAVGAPVLQSPRALMEAIDEYYLNDANQVAYTGRFSEARENAYGVWAGEASNPVQIFQTGSSIPGLDNGQTYFKTLKLALGDDGALMQLIEVQVPVEDPVEQAQVQAEPEEQTEPQEQAEPEDQSVPAAQDDQPPQATSNRVYLASRGAQHTVLMSTNTQVQGLIGSVDIDAIEVTDHSLNTHAVVSKEKIITTVPVEQPPGTIISEDDEIEEIEETTEQYTLWYLNGTGAKAIVHSWIDKAQSAPTLANGCRIYAPDNKVDNLRLNVTSNNSLVFQAQVGGDGDCEKGRAVLRYVGNGLREIVKDGDTVPGSTTHVFNDVSLYQVTADGSVVVFANLATPAQIEAMTPVETTEEDDEANRIAELIGVDTDDEEIDDGQWSFWIMPPQGAARLIALEGEEIQVGPAVSILSGEPRSLSLQLNASNQVALKVLLQDAEEPVYFVGTGHAGQPHASIDIPGASALRYAFTSNSGLPGQGPEAVLSALGTPYLDSSGNLVLYGEVGPSDEAKAAVAEANETAQSTAPATSAAVTQLIKPFNSIWQVNPQGVMRELVRSGDQVSVAGVSKELASLSVVGQIARPGSSGVRLNSAGAMLLRATIERRFGNPVLLYIAP